MSVDKGYSTKQSPSHKGATRSVPSHLKLEQGERGKRWGEGGGRRFGLRKRAREELAGKRLPHRVQS